METIVVGCDAVEAGPDWVRLRVDGGAVRTIAWSSITAASAPVDGEHVTFEGTLGPITRLRATHDPLWIEYGDGIAIALLERDHAKRKAILGTFREQLGPRWMEHLTAMEAAQRMFKPMGSSGMNRRLKVMILVMVAMLVLPILAFILIHFVH